jgi:hypothetical protein
MPPSPSERTPREQATLVFSSPEEAARFKENVREKVEQQSLATSADQREAVAQTLAQEFTAAGEAVDVVREPWTHTPQEHHEVQQLVDLAFAKDLPTAIHRARKSPHYPRNLDLLHDVITGELYKLIAEGSLNRQPIMSRLVLAGAAVLIVLLALVFIMLSL